MPYSKWFRTDLHIHTDKSKETKDGDYNGSFNVQKLHNKLVENKVALFSLTDHNIINIEAYREYYSKFDKPSDPKLLLGVELDIIDKDQQNTYHTLLIFNTKSITQIENINRKIEEHFNSNGTNILERTLSFEELHILFSELEFFFIPHANGKKSINKTMNIEDANKMVLLMPSALEKVKEKAIQGYLDEFKKIKTEEFKNKTDIAFITFSDNHNINKYPCNGKDGKKHQFYYLKGSPNYETLRLAFIDPLSRICTQEKYESIRRGQTELNYLEEIMIPNGCNKLVEKKITFSPHMNVIIGGRSSGKSLLLNTIGKRIEATDTIKYKELYSDMNKVQLKFKDNQTLSIEAKLNKSDYIYISQGEIADYFESRNLSKLVDSLDKQKQYSESKTIFSNKAKSFNQIKQELVDNFNKLIFVSNDTKDITLRQKTLEYIQIKEFAIEFDEKKCKKRLPNLDNIETIINELKSKTSELKTNTELDISEDDLKIINKFERLIELKQEFLKGKKACNTKKRLFYDKVKSIIVTKNSAISEEATFKQKANTEKKNLISNIKSYFEACTKLNKSSNNFEKFDYKVKESISLMENVKIVIETPDEMEENSILDIAKSMFKKHNYKINNLYQTLLLLSRNQISLIRVSKGQLDTKLKSSFKEFISFYDNPTESLFYNNTNESSKTKSPGFNAEQYLKLLINSSNSKIIFIDQPEDNLGNKFISEDLVEDFRRIKFTKQIILVTHNPSIVVYGDAENVIMAYNDENKISYRQLPLEMTENGKEICNALDGGSYIFNNRSRKYNIKRLLIETKN